jgi:hypothetical protein
MSNARNVLIAFGASWLSLLTVPWLSLAFGKLNSKITYDSVWFEAIAMGMMTSMGRAFAASLAAVITTTAVDARKPERWALIVAALYLFDAPIRYGARHIAPTAWDRGWQIVDRIWPAVACLIFAIVASRLLTKRTAVRSIEPAS